MKKGKVIVIIVCVLSLCSCRALWRGSEKGGFQPVIPSEVSESLAKTTTFKEKELIVEKREASKETREIFSWKGKRISKTRGTGLAKARKKYKLSMVYDTIDMYQIVTNILQDVLRKDFVIEGNLNITVSVSIQGEFTERELMDFLSFVLETSGFTMVSKSNIIYIKPSGSVPQAPLFSGFYWWFYAPRFLGVKEVVNLILPFKSKDGVVIPIGTNAVLIMDRKAKVQTFQALVRLVDIDILSGYDLRIFKVSYSEPSELAKEVEKTLYSMGLKGSFSLIPVDRLNYLIAIARSSSLGDKIASLIKALDAPSEVAGKRVYIYKVQHVDSKKLADTLRKFLSGKEKIETPAKGKKTGKVAASILKSEVIIVADPVTNTLLIEATPKDYERMKRIITELDSIPRQVLIEVLIAEVSLEKELEYGIEWWLRFHASSYTGTATVTYGLQSTVNKLVGFTYYGINPDNFWNFLYFLTTNSKVRVLSSPHILVRDNQKAKIDVGKEVPILTLETVGTTQIEGTSAIDRRVEYRDVGIILEVKPHISEEGFVTLEITEETSNPEPNTVSGIDSPIISKRKVTTTLMVKNGHTVVIGGIIDTRREKVKKSLPLISKLPLIGSLFSYERHHRSRTELIVMLTPHVISNVREADIITSVFQNRLQKLMGTKK